MIRTPEAPLNTMCQSLVSGSLESTENVAPFGDEVDSWLDEIVMRDEFEDDEEFDDEDDEDDDEGDDDDDWDDDDDDWDDDDADEEDDDEDMIAAPYERPSRSSWY